MLDMVASLLRMRIAKFQIERDGSGYALEVSGYFRFIGESTLRYRRDFIQNGRPI